jgi:hypothetical protein
MKKNNRLERVSAADLIEQPEEGETAGALPPALAAALSDSEGVLARHQKLADVLIATSRSIPEALAEEQRLYSQLGAAEVAGDDDVDGLRSELAGAQDARNAARRQRSAVVDSIRDMESDLRRAREGIEQSRAAYGAGVLADFNSRWAEGCRMLAVLQAEAAALARALRVQVSCPAPYTVAMSVIGDRPTVRFSLPIEPSPVSLPPGLAAVAGVVDRLDAAAALGAALRQSIETDQRHQALARIQLGVPAQMTGCYRVIREVSHCGANYPVGTLLDASLLSHGELFRFWKGRQIEPLNAVAAHRVA